MISAIVAGTLVLPTVSVAQQFRAERITPDQGLSQSFVHCIMQDSRGFMWFGTRDGLNKYDGYRFVVYRPRPFDSSSLSVNVVTAIAEDSSGGIWGGTYFQGLSRLDRATGKARRYVHDPHKPASLSGNSISCIYTDRSGNLWVGTTEGLNLYRSETDDFIRFVHDPLNPQTLAHDSIEFIEEDADGNLWIGSGSRHISRFDPGSRIFTRFSILRERSVANGKFIGDDPAALGCVMASARMRSYVLQAEPTVFDDVLSAMERGLHRQGLTWDYLRIERDAVWLRGAPFHPGYSGLYVVSDSDARSGSTFGLSSPIVRGNITTLYRDRSGVDWVGTEDGIVKLTSATKNITTYRHDPFNPSSLSNSRIRCVLKDRAGRLWVGADEGVNRFDSVDDTWRRYYDDPTLPDHVAGNTVNVIFQDRDGALLIGTNSGIRRYDPRLDRFVRDYQRGEEYPVAVWSMYRDADGALWVGTKQKGVYVFDARGRLIRRFRSIPGNDSALCDDRVWCMAEDRQGRLWIGTTDGLNRWDPVRRAFRQYRHDARRPRSLCGDNIWSLYNDDDGNLWVGAYGGGLSRYDPATDDFTSFTTNEGLPSDAVYGMLSDGRGNLWISTNTGLAVYDPGTRKTLRVYDAGDGLQGNEFSFKAFFKAVDGEMFFGGLNGLSRFYPDRIRDNPNVPQLAVTSYRIFDKIVGGELFDGDRIEVDYNQNFISFEFAALDYVNPGKNRYAYMLEGFDETWVECGARRYVSYTNLDPGEYVLRVRGSNNDNRWNEAGLRLSIHVLPPFWLTLWFKCLVVGALVLLVVMIIHYRVAALRRRERLGRKILESQLQALRAQMNPHFIFNSLNSIHQLILEGSEDEASEYLTKFAHLVRMVLENSRQQSITVAAEVEYLTIYLELESLRFGGRLRYSIDIESPGTISSRRIPSMLIQPYVENAIRHGLLARPEGGMLAVGLREREGYIVCTVEDNGIGRELALERRLRSGVPYRPMGMLLARRRLELFNAIGNTDIRVEVTDLYRADRTPQGTRVEISIPMEFHTEERQVDYDTLDYRR